VIDHAGDRDGRTGVPCVCALPRATAMIIF